MDSNVTCTCPPIRSASEGAAPRYGTCTISTPAIILNNSPATWGADPLPCRRHVDLARIGLGISDELRNRRSGNRRIDLHDEGGANNASDRAMSRMKLKLSFSYSVALIAFGAPAKRSV